MFHADCSLATICDLQLLSTTFILRLGEMLVETLDVSIGRVPVDLASTQDEIKEESDDEEEVEGSSQNNKTPSHISINDISDVCRNGPDGATPLAGVEAASDVCGNSL